MNLTTIMSPSPLDKAPQAELTPQFDDIYVPPPRRRGYYIIEMPSSPLNESKRYNWIFPDEVLPNNPTVFPPPRVEPLRSADTTTDTVYDTDFYTPYSESDSSESDRVANGFKTKFKCESESADSSVDSSDKEREYEETYEEEETEQGGATHEEDRDDDEAGSDADSVSLGEADSDTDSDSAPYPSERVEDSDGFDGDDEGEESEDDETTQQHRDEIVSKARKVIPLRPYLPASTFDFRYSTTGISNACASGDSQTIVPTLPSLTTVLADTGDPQGANPSKPSYSFNFKPYTPKQATNDVPLGGSSPIGTVGSVGSLGTEDTEATVKQEDDEKDEAGARRMRAIFTRDAEEQSTPTHNGSAKSSDTEIKVKQEEDRNEEGARRMRAIFARDAETELPSDVGSPRSLDTDITVKQEEDRDEEGARRMREAFARDEEEQDGEEQDEDRDEEGARRMRAIFARDAEEEDEHIDVEGAMRVRAAFARDEEDDGHLDVGGMYMKSFYSRNEVVRPKREWAIHVAKEDLILREWDLTALEASAAGVDDGRW